MKNILKIMVAVFLLMGTGKAFAQPNVDLVLTGGPNMGTYPGFVMPATYDVTFTNGSGTTISANHFVIILSVPNGFQFDASYPALPAGWSYVVQPGSLSVNLKPTAPVSGFPPFGIVTFNVPMHTLAPVTSQPFLGQIQVLFPSFQDPDNTNNTPQGLVTVLNAVALPVRFSSFNAVADGCKANISWTTGQETGNKYFSVERSSDGIVFENIGQVEARGTKTTGGEYTFTDMNPASGKNFYRVKQYDVDGKATATRTLPVTFNCGTTKIEIFPNPTSELVNVKGLTGKNTIKIMTIAGHEVMKADTELETYGMRVNALASGTYQVQVVKDGEIVFNGKFVKAD